MWTILASKEAILRSRSQYENYTQKVWNTKHMSQQSSLKATWQPKMARPSLHLLWYPNVKYQTVTPPVKNGFHHGGYRSYCLSVLNYEPSSRQAGRQDSWAVRGLTWKKSGHDGQMRNKNLTLLVLALFVTTWVCEHMIIFEVSAQATTHASQKSLPDTLAVLQCPNQLLWWFERSETIRIPNSMYVDWNKEGSR